MKKLSLLLFILLAACSVSAQVILVPVGSPNQITKYAGSLAMDKNLSIPRGCGIPTPASFADFSTVYRSPYIYFDTCNNDLYMFNPSGNQVVKINAPIPDGLIAGGQVAWSGTGLAFNVTAANYAIAGKVYYSAAASITLDAASANFPRYDVIAVDVTGAVVKITGVPSVNPVIPQVDPATQVQLTVVLIGAGATTPTVTEQVVYDENTEGWTGVPSAGLSLNLNNTTNVTHGTKSADVGAWTVSKLITFTKNTGYENVADYTLLTFDVSLKDSIASSGLRIDFMKDNTVISKLVVAGAGNGFVYTKFNSYQHVVMSMSGFQFTQSQFNKVRVRLITKGKQGLYLDYLRLQSGVYVPAPAGGVQSVRGLNTDNNDPANPVVKISVDGTTITGQGTPADPLKSVSIVTETDPLSVHTSDSAAMLFPYLRKLDASALYQPKGNYLTTETDPLFDTKFAAKTTDQLTEGTTNLYYTAARAGLKLSLSDTAAMLNPYARKNEISGGTTLNGIGFVKMAGTIPSYVPIIGLTEGGTGTATPSLVAGNNISITGSFPNQAISTSAILNLDSIVINANNLVANSVTPRILLKNTIANGGIQNSPAILFSGYNVSNSNQAWGMWENSVAGSGGGLTLGTINTANNTGTSFLTIDASSANGNNRVLMNNATVNGTLQAFTLMPTGANATLSLYPNTTFNETSGDRDGIRYGTTVNNKTGTGNFVAHKFMQTINQSSGAVNNYGMVYSQYEQVLGAGTQVLATWGTQPTASFVMSTFVPKATIFNNGNFSLAGSMTAAGLLTGAGYQGSLVTKNSAYTITGNDEFIKADATSGAFNITLPTAIGRQGQTYTIKKVDATANVVTVNTTASQTVDGAATYLLDANNKWVTVTSDNANWLIKAASATAGGGGAAPSAPYQQVVYGNSTGTGLQSDAYFLRDTIDAVLNLRPRFGGTVTNTAGGSTVTGSGTRFISSFRVGDQILINGENKTITTITSNTALTVSGTFTNANTGAAYSINNNGNGWSFWGNGTAYYYGSIIMSFNSGNTNYGSTAGLNTTGIANTNIGNGAGGSGASGSSNTFVGDGAGTVLTSGASNVGVARGALAGLTSGSFNTALGRQALQNVSTQSNNVGIGYNAGRFLQDNITTFTQSNSTYLGTEIRGSSTGVTNETVIGYLAYGNGSNTVTIGSRDVTQTSLFGSIQSPIHTPTGVGSTNIINSGGSIAPQAIYYKIAAVDALGNTSYTSGAAGMTITTAGSSVQITLPALPVGAVGWNIYRASGSATNFVSPSGIATNVTGTYLDVFATPPLAGTPPAVTSAFITKFSDVAGGNSYLNNGGKFGINTIQPAYTLDVNGTAQATQYKISALNTAPASATATGTTGEIRIASDYIYVCIATNTWVRAALSTW